MDILDMSVNTEKSNRYVLVIVDCFSRWTEASCPLPNKTAVAIADAFFQLIICRWASTQIKAAIHLMQELWLLLGVHRTCTTPYHLASDGFVERFNRMLIMAMFAREHRQDWDYLLPTMMMAYCSSGFSPYRLISVRSVPCPWMWGYPDVTQTRRILFKEVAYNQVRCHASQAVQRQKRPYDKWAVKRVFTIGDWTMRYYPLAQKCKLDSPWLGPYLVVSIAGLGIGVQLQPDSPVLLVHCQDLKKILQPRGLVSWLPSRQIEQPTDRSWELVWWVGLRLALHPPVCLDYFRNRLCLSIRMLRMPDSRHYH